MELQPKLIAAAEMCEAVNLNKFAAALRYASNELEDTVTEKNNETSEREIVNSSKSSITSTSLSFGSVLLLVFLVLKLTGVITWSWWWITAPLWGEYTIILCFFLIAILISFIIDLGSR